MNFVGNAYLSSKPENNKINVTPYELIPYILGKCKTVEDAIDLLNNIVLVDIRFRDEISNAQLHWIISDKTESITYEYMKDGIKIYA